MQVAVRPASVSRRAYRLGNVLGEALQVVALRTEVC